jgi:hypothetical protein
MTCHGEFRHTGLDLFSRGGKSRAPMMRVASRVTSWLTDVRLTQIFALLVAMTVIAPPGFHIENRASRFLASLRTELIPFESGVQAPHMLPVQRSEARLSQNRVSLGLATTLFTVPPIIQDRPAFVTTNYRHRFAAHSLAFLRAPPLA